MKLCELRQGVVLIAVFDTLLSGILLFLLLLGSSHAQDMSEMLEADMLDSGRRDDGWSSRINVSRMQHGQHLATGTSSNPRPIPGPVPEPIPRPLRPQERAEILNLNVLRHGYQAYRPLSGESRLEWSNNQIKNMARATIVTMYAVISIVTVHLISCISLLCGAIMRIHQFLVPWASVVLVELFLGVVLLMAAAFTGSCSMIIFSVSAVTLQFYMSMWGIVWTYYRKLCRETCEEYQTEDADKTAAIKSDYIKFPCTKPQNV